MLTKPRTVCFCQAVSSMISVSVAPLARFIIAMTSAFLLVRSAAAGLLATVFLAGFVFLVAFAFFGGFAPSAGFLGLASASLAWALLASGWMAFQTRATAFLRSANFST